MDLDRRSKTRYWLCPPWLCRCWRHAACTLGDSLSLRQSSLCFMMKISLTCRVGRIWHKNCRAVHRTLKPETPLEPLMKSFTAEFGARQIACGLSLILPFRRRNVFFFFRIFRLPDFHGISECWGHPAQKIHAERSSNGCASHRGIKNPRWALIKWLSESSSHIPLS